MSSLPPSLHQHVHIALEDLLIEAGFERGVLAHLIEGRGGLSRQIRQVPDGDWTNKNVFQENVRDLGRWAVRRLERQGVARRDPSKKPTQVRYGNTTSALGYALASSPEIQAGVKDIRRRFWEADEPPFPAKTLGMRAALEAAGAWLNAARERDDQREPVAQFLGLDLVLRNEDKTLDLHDVVRRAVHKFSELHEDGTLRGTRMTVHDLFTTLNDEFQGTEVEISHRTVRGCGDDGKERLILQMRGTSGWRDLWPAVYGGELHDLGRACQEVTQLSGKWDDAETLEYVMTGVVPSLGARINWTGLGDANATLTLTFRAPVTREDALAAYDTALNSRFLNPVKARRLSVRHQAVMQLVHDMPEATWKERLVRYEEWRTRHPELPEYRGLTAQQAIRKDYERAMERTGWQSLPGEGDDFSE